MSLGSKNKRTVDKLTKPLIPEAEFFLEPQNPKQRQYEALRAFFVDRLPGKDVADRFGYSLGAFRVLCHCFRNNPEPVFFVDTKPGPKYSPKKDQAGDLVISLRKRNYSIEDIHSLLIEKGLHLSTVSIWTILKEAGFSKLPRRHDDERPARPRPDRAEYADIRQLDLSERSFDAKVGGVFLLMRILADMNIHKIPAALGWYGSKMIPAENAFLSCLLLKLISKKRKSHVMDLMFDEGASLSTGLNVLPKTSYMSEYSQRLTHEDNIEFLHRWLKTLRKTNVIYGESFNLDFQSLPYFGDEDVVEKHYVSMRSRRQKAILVFFAQDAKSKIFCYSNADLRKGEEADEIFRFIEFWKKQAGKNPSHLVFDSKLTTYANLSKLNKDLNITFVTLRRRTPNVLKDVMSAPPSAWRRITLSNVARKYRYPKVIDKEVRVKGYEGIVRQIYVKDLGHDLPTIVLTNDKKTSCTHLIERYALRMIIENSIAEAVEFFHTTALSSSVAIKIDFDVLMTLVGQSAYRLLSNKLRGYERSSANVIFRKFIDTPAKIFIGKREIEVRLSKRANDPILLESGLVNSPFRLPWIGGKKVIVTVG